MSLHFVGWSVRPPRLVEPTTASTTSRERGRLWEFASVTQVHVHDFQVTTLPTCFVCMVPGCGVTVRLLPPVRR